jgi:hypothetical protein
LVHVLPTRVDCDNWVGRGDWLVGTPAPPPPRPRCHVRGVVQGLAQVSAVVSVLGWHLSSRGACCDRECVLTRDVCCRELLVWQAPLALAAQLALKARKARKARAAMQAPTVSMRSMDKSARWVKLARLERKASMATRAPRGAQA